MIRRFFNTLKLSILDRLLICIVCVGIVGVFNLNIANRHFKEPILAYAEKEVVKLSNNIINQAVILNLNEFNNEAVTTNVDLSGKITSIDFNTTQINALSSAIAISIHKYLNAVETGDNELLSSLNINTQFNNGIIYEVPIGIVTNNALLSSSGYKIPVRLEMAGDVITGIKSEVSEYGINNVMIKVFLDVKVSVNVIVPLAYKGSVIETQIPIIMKVVQGEIPEAFLGFDTIK